MIPNWTNILVLSQNSCQISKSSSRYFNVGTLFPQLCHFAPTSPTFCFVSFCCISYLCVWFAFLCCCFFVLFCFVFLGAGVVLFLFNFVSFVVCLFVCLFCCCRCCFLHFLESMQLFQYFFLISLIGNWKKVLILTQRQLRSCSSWQKETSKLCITVHLWGESPVTGRFSSRPVMQKTSLYHDAEMVMFFAGMQPSRP